MKQTQKRPSSGKRKALMVLNCFLAVILALMLGFTILANALMNKLNRVDATQESIDSGSLSDFLTDKNDPEEQDGDSTLLGQEKEIVNILLIGQDRREGEDRARSDAMILVTINKNTKSIVMTSFLRDLYVQIPGYGSNRLNASYVWGGMKLLNETLEQNFDIYVDGNVEVDFDQFSQIVDMLGGVQIELRSDEAQMINGETGGSLTAGMQKLNGAQALSYARIRKLDADGDFSRTQRQRTVLDALVQQVKTAGIVKLFGIVDDILPMVTTDMTNSEILSYATALLPILSRASIVSQRIPADGAYSYATVDGMSVLKADMEANRQILRDTLGG